MVGALARRHQWRVRARLADSLEEAVREVDRPLRRAAGTVAIDRRAVAEAAPLLLCVASRLREEEPLSPEAMGLVRSLVSDGAGPLYARSAHRSEYPPGTLGRFARAILVACEDRVSAPGPGGLVRI